MDKGNGSREWSGKGENSHGELGGESGQRFTACCDRLSPLPLA